MAKRKVKKKVQKPSPEGVENEPGFEESLARLEEIASELEDGHIGLETALARYEEGVGLLRRCGGLLNKAQRRIELLSGLDADGNPVTTPLDDDRLSLEEKAQSRSRRRTAGSDSGGSGLDNCESSGDDVDESGTLF